MDVSSFLRTEPINFDPFQRPRCVDADSFAAWIDSSLAETLKDPTPAELDQAMLRVAQEYLLRRRGVPVHRKQICLLDIFHERMDMLWEKQRSLLQAPSFQSRPTHPSYQAIPAVFFAQKEDE